MNSTEQVIKEGFILLGVILSAGFWKLTGDSLFYSLFIVLAVGGFLIIFLPLFLDNNDKEVNNNGLPKRTQKVRRTRSQSG